MKTPTSLLKAEHDMDADFQRIIDARHHDPFSILGRHESANKVWVRAFLPRAIDCTLLETGLPLQRIEGTDLFEWHGPAEKVPYRYQLLWHDNHGNEVTQYDPYCFPPVISDYDLSLFAQGSHWHIYRVLGARVLTIDGITGTLFATWAPNAERVSVTGDFNEWDGRVHPMRSRSGSGVWELFIPGIGAGALYKFEIRNRHYGSLLLKSDPYGRHFEQRPSTAAIVDADTDFEWQDHDWSQKRAHGQWQHQPMSVYEVHLGSWQRDEPLEFLNYRELAHRLVDYVQDMGFTHIELLPVNEHPLDASWGYQATGYYAPTSRFGTPDDFRYFVNHCHTHGIGVLLDWVPAHFPKDAHALATFDGSALYEHADPRRGEHRDWGTLIFNYGRSEVKNFLLSSAIFWLEEFHIDGLRVDAVASMLYLDYSREAHDWIPNELGGRENLEAIEFLRELNTVSHQEFPGTLIIAEESTSWSKVSKPIYDGGLGFSMKWNMGWMHDTLEYYQNDPLHRQHHHDRLTFGMLYTYSENFVLPFSHDEVVHGKSSMLHKMPGDEWQRFANLRLLYTYMFTYPGKKLLFMGCEFGQGIEWNHDKALEWWLLEFDLHAGMKRLVKDLNQRYRDMPALHGDDFSPEGFSWIDCNDKDQSTLSYIRRYGDHFVVVILNLTPVPRPNFRLGVPAEGHYHEIMNSDSKFYAGSNLGNSDGCWAEPIPHMNQPWSISLTLPPLAGLILSL